MKYALFLLAILVLRNLHATPANTEVRALFKQAAKEQAKCEKLLSLVSNYDESNNPLLGGYRACATMMMARYTANPLVKLSRFNEGKELLEKCIAKGKDPVELRFLRLTIQVNAPSILGYNDHIASDKAFLLAVAKTIHDAELKQLIVTFMTKYCNLSETEKKKLSEHIAGKSLLIKRTNFVKTKKV